jgi:hypothetical protein
MYFSFFIKVKVEVVQALEICHNTKFHGPMLTGASSASALEV